MIIAHRAGKPENTLKAFEQSVINEIPSIEFDVHLTIDKELVITHDYEINGIKISDLSLNEIKDMSPEVPTLFEVLECVSKCCNNKNVGVPLLNIEVKPWNIIEELTIFIKWYLRCQSTVKLSDLVFTSFIHTEIIKIREYLPKARIGYIYRCWPVDIIKDLKEYNVDLIVLSEHVVMSNLISDLKSQMNVDVWVYTINDFDRAYILTHECFVDGIITDIPHDFKNKIVSLI